MMLGINALKPLVKGEFARAVDCGLSWQILLQELFGKFAIMKIKLFDYHKNTFTLKNTDWFRN